MQCPKCKAEIRSEPGPDTRSSGESRPAETKVATTAEEALRADAPPGPCPQCGWSTMWNE
jgi:hypothetical protein